MTKMVKWLGLALMLVLGAGVTLAARPTPAAAFACWKCDFCSQTDYHKMTQAGNDVEGGHSVCIHGGCTDSHPSCGGGGETFRAAPGVERLLAAVEAGEVEAAEKLVTRYAGQVHWNRERHSLQLTAPCLGDEYFGNLPLSPAQEAALEAQFE